MSFNPKDTGIVNNSGIYPSSTTITSDENNIRIVSDGDPYPAKAGNPLNNDGVTERSGWALGTYIQTKTIDLTFNYRGGRNSANPQNVEQGPIGIATNGVLIYTSKNNDILFNSATKPPDELHWDISIFSDVYKGDLASGYIDETGAYRYVTGAFVPAVYSRERKIYQKNEYYGSNSYGNDFMRHQDGHSKIVGYAFDGYPIYGPFGYDDPLEPLSRPIRTPSAYRLRDNDDHRPNGYKITDTYRINNQERNFTLGTFVEDYEYVSTLSTLDEHNGRYCITPEYPNGTYAYFLTFKDNGLVEPAYPYVIGPQSKQQRTAGIGTADIISLWSVRSGTVVANLAERRPVIFALPVTDDIYPSVELLSGNLPSGTRIEGNNLVGTPFEVERDTSYQFVLRAKYNGIIDDRTFIINVVGPDDPVWITNEGRLQVGSNNTLYILDNALVDFQLSAIDSDLPAGDELEYFIANGDGELPPGLSLSEDGKITGVVEPLLALDRIGNIGGYDNEAYDTFITDFSIKSDFGFSSYYYDILGYDNAGQPKIPKKLNRYYSFAVTVTDGDSWVRREFTIYLVGDDYLRADNTIMQAADGVFTADNTHLRNPVWLTPSDLGFKRANNYVTLYTDIIESDTLAGFVFYELLDFNPDRTPSLLPPGLTLNTGSGEIAGRVPYQPAITNSYKFTLRATRFEADTGTVEVIGTFNEDTLIGRNNLKVAKLPQGLEDGVDDLASLRNQVIRINDKEYEIIKVDGSNSDYDLITLDRSVTPKIRLITSQSAVINDEIFFVNRLSETEKTRYLGRFLNFNAVEKYEIKDILPYLEYRIKMKDSSAILIEETSLNLKVGQEFILGDYAYYNGAIYQLSSTDLDLFGDPTRIHTVVSQQDDNGAIINDSEGNPVVDFNSSKWSFISNTSAELSETVNRNIFEQRLQMDFAMGALQRLSPQYQTNIYLTEVYPADPAQLWSLRMPSTANSRNSLLVKKYLKPTNLSFVIYRDNEDRVEITSNIEATPGLLRNIASGADISISIFKRDSFTKLIKVLEQDEIVDLPFSDKTFDIRIIGEIDSTIEFLTERDLGNIKANFVSTFKLNATTTVPDTNLIYRIISGKLPNGMRLNLDGDIIGKPRQYINDEGLGLTTFDNYSTVFDSLESKSSTFDRDFVFTVEAKDRFGYSAVTKEFKITVVDDDKIRYSNIYVKPLLEPRQRQSFTSFVSNPKIFPNNKIYRPDDPEFGIQTTIKMLVYAGIETQDIANFVAATSLNHKRTNFKIGDFKMAEAKQPGTNEVIYEAIYLEVIDPSQPINGKARKSFTASTTETITTDSIQYDTKDDITNTGTGFQELPVYGRNTVKFVIPNGDDLIILTRDSNVTVDVDNNDFEIELRDGSDVEIELGITDSEPYRIRPKTNTIKADNTAIRASDFRDQKKYIVNIDNMRSRIQETGQDEREYLPLWMRTPQANTFPQELDYVTAIPVCFCKPGKGTNIMLNIRNAITNNLFDQTKINFEFDRYIIDQTNNNSNEQYILFANYQYNV